MTVETYKCVKTSYNSNMGTECWSNETTIFYSDRNGWVKVGDEVKLERDDKGFYRSVWVNGVLKTVDNFGDIHGMNKLKQLAHTYTTMVINEVIKAREDQILNILKEHGFEFKNRIELAQFAKSRCTVEKYPNRLNVLRVDGEFICDWWDTSRFVNDDPLTFSVIIGEAPGEQQVKPRSI